MASIVSSVIAWDNPQIDERRMIREVHTDDRGNQYIFDYMAGAHRDVNAKMLDRVPSVEQMAADEQARQDELAGE